MSAAESESDEDWDNYSYVIGSKHRLIVVQRLAGSPATPSMIAEDTELRLTHVSRVLGDLNDSGLVELLVPEERRKGRVYGLTETGEMAVDMIEEYGGGGA